MAERPPLTPCLICEKAVLYLWDTAIAGDAENLDGACDIQIAGSYGSDYDLSLYKAIICDECMDKAIQSRRVVFIKDFLDQE